MDKTSEELLSESLNGKNLIIFADGVDLNEIPYDRNFIDKIYIINKNKRGSYVCNYLVMLRNINK